MPDYFSKLIDEIGVNERLPPDNEKTLAILAATIGCSKECLVILHQRGADFSVQDSHFPYNNTPLVWSIANANNSCADELLKLGVDVGIDILCRGNTALHLAIVKGYQNVTGGRKELTISNASLVRSMITLHDADPNIIVHFPESSIEQPKISALLLAVVRGDVEILSGVCLSKKLTVATINSALTYLAHPATIDDANKILDYVYKNRQTREMLRRENFSAENQSSMSLILLEKLSQIEAALSHPSTEVSLPAAQSSRSQVSHTSRESWV